MCIWFDAGHVRDHEDMMTPRPCPKGMWWSIGWEVGTLPATPVGAQEAGGVLEPARPHSPAHVFRFYFCP